MGGVMSRLMRTVLKLALCGASAAVIAMAMSASVAGAHALPASATEPNPGPPFGDGVLSVALTPLSPSSTGATPNAAPVIACNLDLRQYPHSSTGGVSWHYTWSCSESARAYGRGTLYVGNFPVAHESGNQYGFKGDFNVRFGCSPSPAYYSYQGSAVVTFSAPGYTSATASGYGPTARIPCS